MKVLYTLIILLYCLPLSGQTHLIEKIENLIRNKDAKIGVAIIHKDKTITLNNEEKYPLMSVFKFHVVVAAIKKLENDNVPIDAPIYVDFSKMPKNTYSPLKDKYGNSLIKMTYKTVMIYALSHSDNNMCDFLIEFAGGIDKVYSYIKTLGIDGFHLSETEESMHEDISKSYRNFSTPLSMARLMKKVYEGGVLSSKNTAFLEKTMLECSTGENKLKAGLPQSVRIGHKTGHSDRTSDGIRIAENDAGIIYLPSGEQYYICVFIMDSKESDYTNCKIIADIAKITHENLN